MGGVVGRAVAFLDSQVIKPATRLFRSQQAIHIADRSHKALQRCKPLPDIRKECNAQLLRIKEVNSGLWDGAM